ALRDEQAEAGTRGAVAAAVELAEDPLLLGLRDADALVFDGDLDGVLGPPRRDSNRSAVGGELHRVVDERSQDLAQLVAVSLSSERRVREIEHERMTVLRRVLNAFQDLGDHGADTCR